MPNARHVILVLDKCLMSNKKKCHFPVTSTSNNHTDNEVYFTRSTNISSTYAKVRIPKGFCCLFSFSKIQVSTFFTYPCHFVYFFLPVPFFPVLFLPVLFLPIPLLPYFFYLSLFYRLRVSSTK